MKHIIITGASTGFGFEAAKYFLAQGWQVIATMRNPESSKLPVHEKLTVLPLDVTSPESIARLVEQVGQIDVLVNNAGIGMLGALEGTSEKDIEDVFLTNTLGTIKTTKAFLPKFREQRSGTIINVTSSITLEPLPLLSVYTASKSAVNAFTESLAIELAEFDIRVNLVLPGRAPETQFGTNAQSRMKHAFPEPYSALASQVFAGWQKETKVTYCKDVVEAIWQAATDNNSPMKIIAGEDALAMCYKPSQTKE